MQTIPPHSFPGTFIVLEGIGGSGKDTQALLLKERLEKQGRTVRLISFPNYACDPYGSIIKEYLHDMHSGTPPKVAAYLYAVERHHARPKIISWLKKGYAVIALRYVASALTHQGANIPDPRERNEFQEWLLKLEYGTFRLPKEDVLIYLDMPARLSHALIDRRVASSRNPLDGKDCHEQSIVHSELISSLYHDLIRRFPYWHSVPCSQDGKVLPPEAIAKKVFTLIPRPRNLERQGSVSRLTRPSGQS